MATHEPAPSVAHSDRVGPGAGRRCSQYDAHQLRAARFLGSWPCHRPRPALPRMTAIFVYRRHRSCFGRWLVRSVRERNLPTSVSRTLLCLAPFSPALSVFIEHRSRGSSSENSPNSSTLRCSREEVGEKDLAAFRKPGNPRGRPVPRGPADGRQGPARTWVGLRLPAEPLLAVSRARLDCESAPSLRTGKAFKSRHEFQSRRAMTFGVKVFGLD